MATEKFFVFNEDGALKRLKGRIVRFLDNEDPTGSDKDAIRTSLEVSPDAAGLVQADVGTAPNEIPVNGMLGDMAYQSSDGVSAAKLEVESTTGTSTTQALTVTDGSSTNFVVQEDGKVGVGTGTLASGATLDVNGAVAIGGTRVFSKSSTDLNVGSIDGSPAINTINFKTADTVRATINSSGDLQLKTSGAEISLFNDLTYPGTSRAFISCEGRSGTFNYGGDLVVKLRNDDYSISERARFTQNGLCFNGDTAAANALDDYEEGTWTPALSTGAGESITYATQDGAYTKIGRRVICTARIYISSAATYGSYGHLQISGLPFVAVDSTDHMTFNYGGVYNLNSLLQVGDITGAQAQASGGASFYLQRGQYGGTSDVYYRTALLNTTGYLLFTVSYHTTA